MKAKRIIALLLAATMIFSAVGCGQKEPAPAEMEVAETETEPEAETEETAEPEPITIVIGDVPDKDSAPEEYEKWKTIADGFMDKYPYITVEEDNYVFGVDTFNAKAAAGQLPDILKVHMTEVDKIIEAGYAQDITSMVEKYGYADKYTDDVKSQIVRDDKYYFFCQTIYKMGLFFNKTVMEEAGLVNEDGTIDAPETWEELAVMAGEIKAKTGKAGLVLPTMETIGGWHFMNIAWDYGVEFMDYEDGKWVAKFNSPECVEALQFVSDLKWKYDALSDNMFIDNSMYEIIGSGQGAMVMAAAGAFAPNQMTKNGMTPEEFYITNLPAGPEGRYALSGGDVYMIPEGTSEAVQDAAFKWFEYQGWGFDVDDEKVETYRTSQQANLDSGKVVYPTLMASIWKSGNYVERINGVLGELTNLEMSQVEKYLEEGVVDIRPEEPRSTQDLYSVFSSLMQAVLSDENADIPKLLEDAEKDFQVNFLDNFE